MIMANFPDVSIIIPSFNGREHTIRCLESLEGLDYPKEKVEIVLVDNSSTDNTSGSVKKNFPRVKVIQNNKNKGPAHARNIGVVAATANLIAFLDNDVVVEKNWLKTLVSTMTADPRAGICCSKVLFLNNKQQINSTGAIANIYGDSWGRGIFEQDGQQYDDKREVFSGCCAAMLTKKDLIDQVGCFDKDYFYLYEDLDYSWRINMAGFKVLYVPESLAYHRFGAVMKRGTFLVRYFTERNRILTLLKNYEAKTLLKIFPGIIMQRSNRAMQGVAGIKKRWIQHAASFIAAWVWNIFNIHKTLKKRFSVQAKRCCPDKDIIKLMGKHKFEVFVEKRS